MSIIRVKKDRHHPYLIMNKSGLNDNRLSLKAKGLLCYLLSKPDDWYVNTNEIISNSTNGVKSVLSAIRELIKYGYMYKHQFRRSNGVFHNYNYLIYECPVSSTSSKTLHQPKRPFRRTVNRLADKGTLLNNKTKINNNLSNNKDLNYTKNDFVVQDDPSIEDFKEYVKLQLYEFGIKDHKKLFDNFPINDIFDYVDWMMPFKSKIKNKIGFLITALRQKWSEPELLKKSRQPVN